MGAVKNHYHDDICENADLERGLEEVGCPYRPDDPRAKAWLAGFRAALVWMRKNT